MRNPLLLSLFCMLLAIPCIHAENSQSKLDSINNARVLKRLNVQVKKDVVSSESGIEVTYTIPLDKKEIESCKSAVLDFDYSGFRNYPIPGIPVVPGATDMIKVPHGCKASFELIESSYFDAYADIVTAEKSEPDAEVAKDCRSAAEPVSLLSSGIYRGLTIERIHIKPVICGIEGNKVRFYTKLRYRINFEESPYLLRTDKCLPEINPNDPFIASLTGYAANNENASQKSTSSQLAERLFTEDYLIISHTKYKEAVEKFAKWKMALGFKVYVKYSASWTASSVKQTVINFYNNYPNLYYLLIIGDQEDVPAYEINKNDEKCVSDLLFGLLDGDSDILPDIYRGRISVCSATQANTVINKIINYEKNPPTTASFYNSGVHIGYYQRGYKKDGRPLDPNITYEDMYLQFTGTCESLKKYVESQSPNINITRLYYTNKETTPQNWEYNSIPNELRKPNFKWNASNLDVHAAFNSGPSYILYLGHGIAKGYESFDYYNNAVKSELTLNNQYNNLATLKFASMISNGNRTPVVFNFSCYTGNFQEAECFAETLQRSTRGGAVGVLAASALSDFPEARYIADVMFTSIWRNDKYRELRIAAALDIALYDMIDYPDLRTGDQEKFWYHWFGDPSMKMYTQKPQAISVSLDASDEDVAVKPGMNACHIKVQTPGLDHLRINILDKSTRRVASYINGEEVYHTFNGEFKNLVITVTADNCLPFYHEVDPSTQYSAPKQVQRKVQEARKSMINEDYVWQYYEEYQNVPNPLGIELTDSKVYNMCFHGITEINGKTYHNLYGLKKNIDVFDENEQYLEDFNFDELKPIMYIRQDGYYYYMLLADFNELRMDNLMGYGSKTYETAIYYYPPQISVWDAYYLVDTNDNKGMPFPDSDRKPFPEEYSKMLFRFKGIPLSLGVNVIKSEFQVSAGGRKYTVQRSCLDDVIEEFGSVGCGFLGMPGALLSVNQSRERILLLRCVYDLDGNTVFPWQRCPDGALGIENAVAGEMRLEWNGAEAKVTGSEGEVELAFTDMQGRCVERFNATGDFTYRPSGLEHGIYILTARSSRGVRTEKIAIR